MRNQIIGLLICSLVLLSCKKEDKIEDPTLNVTTYLVDFEGKPQSVSCSFFLFPEDKEDIVATASSLEKQGQSASVQEFYKYGSYNQHKTIALGNYILAVQISFSEKTVEWGRYAYKKITLSKGEKVNTIMVFKFAGKNYTVEPWNEIKP